MKDVKLALATVNCSMWAARKQIKDVEYKGKLKEGETLPPAAIATVGSKSVFPRSIISEIAKPKAKAVAWLSENGILLSATSAVIPYEKAEEFKSLMSNLESEFNEQVTLLINNYDETLETYANTYPEWRSFILTSAMSKDKIAGKYSFKRRIQPYTTFDDSDVGLHEELVQEFLDQISEDMMEYFSYLLKTERITPKGVESIEVLINKIRSFSFLSPKLMPLASFMENKIKQAQSLKDPNDPLKSLSGDAKRIIEKMVIVLSNPKKLQLMIEELMEGVSYDFYGNIVSTKDLFSDDEETVEALEIAEDKVAEVVNDNQFILLQEDLNINETPVFLNDEVDYSQFQM